MRRVDPESEVQRIHKRSTRERNLAILRNRENIGSETRGSRSRERKREPLTIGSRERRAEEGIGGSLEGKGKAH